MRYLFLTVITILLVGCAGEPEPPPPPAVPSVTQTPPPPSPPSVSPPSATVAGRLASVIRPAPPGTLERFERKSGEVAGRPGMYFMRVATGELEGWALAHDPNRDAFHGASADNRWVTAFDRSQSYLANRATAAVVQWANEQAALVIAQGEWLLFVADGRLWLTRGGPEQATALAVPIPTAASPAASRMSIHAALAPDGASLLVMVEGKLYQVETGSGAHRLVREMPGTVGDVVRHEVRLVPAPDQQTAVLTVRSRTTTITGTTSESRFLRLSWPGEIMDESTAPLWAEMSPNGRQLAATEDLAGITRAVTIFAREQGAPLAQVKEADFCTQGAGDYARWLSDSSGVLVRMAGGHGVLQADGTLLHLPALAGTSAFNEPVPAPGRPDLFALGRTTVVDAAGQVIAAAVPHAEGNWIGVESLDPWGHSSDELRFALQSRGGKGPRCGPLDLPPAAEPAPFTAPGLVVQLPAGDCLNLRAGQSREAPSLTCLSGGMRLYPAYPPGRINKGWFEAYQPRMSTNMAGESWLHVRTDQGQRGWVQLSREYLAWSPPPGGAAGPGEVLLDRLRDEIANLHFWTQVALGERQCSGPWPCGGNLEEFVLAQGQRCGGPWLASFQPVPAYDRQQHGAALAILEQACSALRSAQNELGHPEDTPAWQQRITAIKALTESSGFLR